MRHDVTRTVLLMLFLMVSAAAWAQEGGGVEWEPLAGAGGVIALGVGMMFKLLSRQDRLEAKLNEVNKTLTADIGEVRKTLTAHSERLVRIEETTKANSAKIGELSADMADLRAEVGKVRETQAIHGERLSWIEGAVDRRLKPSRSEEPLPATPG